MPNLREYVAFASNVYESVIPPPKEWANPPPPGWEPERQMSISDAPFWQGGDFTSSGLQCRLYKPIKDGQSAVIAYKGTKPSMGSDLRNDAALAFWANPSQMRDALKSTEEWLAKVSSRTVVTLTGHSLGGAIAQYVGYYTGKRFVTFHAPGMLANVSGLCVNPWISQNLSLGVNYIMAGDVVGNYGRHIGDTVRLSAASFAQGLAAGAAAIALGLPGVAIGGAVVVNQHFMDNFAKHLRKNEATFHPGSDPLA